jgi:hypothetical protein
LKHKIFVIDRVQFSLRGDHDDPFKALKDVLKKGFTDKGGNDQRPAAIRREVPMQILTAMPLP